jgi:H+-transporting ATPase
MVLSALLGFLLMIVSFAHFYVAWKVFGIPIKIMEESKMVTNGVLQTIMYLQISSCPHFVIFSTRVSGWFWESIPSFLFIVAVAGTQVFAMLMSVYGIHELEATAIGWGWGCAVLGISTLVFMLLDVVKVLLIQNWSFEMTARLWPSRSRRAELEKRQAESLYHSKVMANIRKVQQAARMITIVSAWKKISNKK